MRLFINNVSISEIQGLLELLIWDGVWPRGSASAVDGSHKYGIVVVDDANASEAIRVLSKTGILVIPEVPIQTFVRD